MKNKLFAVAIFTVAFVSAGVASAFTFDSKIDTTQEKKDVQTVLNMTGANLTVDGVFGPKTISAVKTFQTMKGLEADGIIGAITRAALTAASADGQGSTTSTVPGCTAGAMFSSTTGASCASVSTLPAGCTAGAMFSSTTGLSCSAGTPATTVTGGAGSISAVETSTDVETYMVEGQADVKVLGFKITANDSDAKVTNLKITLDQSGSASTYLDRYVSDVAVWMNGSKVATIAASEFNKDSAGTYSKSISLDNAIVKEGTSNKATFYVTISGISNIDTDDMDATWVVSAGDFRYQDGTGVIMSYLSGDITTLVNSLTVKDINTTGDVKLVITKDSSSPAAGNVKVSDTSSSTVPLLVFKAKNTGADMTFDTMSIDVTSTTNSVAMIGELTLKANGSSVATWTPTVTSPTSTVTAAFDLDSTYTISKDSTVVFTVEAKINDIDNFVAGTVVASYNAATVFEVASTRTALTEEGAAAGEIQTFFANGIVASAFTYGTPVVNTNTSGTTTSATYAISFKVTASGASYYVKKSGGLVALANGSATATFADLSATGATLDGSSFLVADGDTATFTTTGVIGSAASGFAKIPLSTLSYGTTNTGVGATYTFSPATSFETSSTYFVD